MGNIDLEVAQVLEDAADLYESEQIEWCRGFWYRGAPGGPLSMCAEGALMRAAGFNTVDVKRFQDSNQMETILALSPVGIGGGYRKLMGARAAITASLPDDKSLGKIGIPYWNDNMKPDEVDANPKQVVIDKFREVAKDLRNQAPATTLFEYKGEAAA